MVSASLGTPSNDATGSSSSKGLSPMVWSVRPALFRHLADLHYLLYLSTYLLLLVFIGRYEFMVLV